MEILALLAFVVFMIYLIVPFLVFSLQSRVNRLEDEIRDLHRKLDLERLESFRTPIELPEKQVEKVEIDESEPEVVVPPPPRDIPSLVETVFTSPPTVEAPTPLRDEQSEPTPTRQLSAAAVEWSAERWTAWVGAAALLFGLGFFLKYAFDRGWIGPEIRVLMGLGFSAALFALAVVLLRRDYRPVGQAVAGTSLGFWYLTLYAAHHWYGLIPEWGMFAAMAFGAADMLALAVVMHAEAIAVLGLLGGFLAPLLMKTQTPSPWPLFSYILLLDASVLAAAGYRNWRISEVLAFVATVCLWMSWFENVYTVAYRFDVLTLITLVFLLFVAVGLWNQFLRNHPLAPSDLFVVFATPVVYSFTVYELTRPDFADWHGGIAAGLAAFYAVLVVYGYRRRPEQRLLRHALAGISLTFLAVAIPLQFTGHWIPIVWAAYAATLVTIGLRHDVPNLRIGGFALLGVVQGIAAVYVIETLEDTQRITPSLLQRAGWVDAPFLAGGWSFINGRSLSMLANALALAWISREYRRRLAPIQPWEHEAAGRMLLSAVLVFAGSAVLETFAYIEIRNWPREGFFGLSGIYFALLVGALSALAIRLGPPWLFNVARGFAAALLAALAIGSLVFAGSGDHGARLAGHPLWGVPVLVNPRGLAFLLTAVVGGLLAMQFRRRPEFSSALEAKSGWTPAAQFAFFALVAGWLTVATETFAVARIQQWNGTELLALSTLHVAALVAGAILLTVRMGPPSSVGIGVVAAAAAALMCLFLGARTIDEKIWRADASGAFWLLPVILNPRGLAFAATAGAMILFCRLCRKRTSVGNGQEFDGESTYTFAAFLAHMILWLAVTVEVYAFGASQNWETGKVLAVTLAWTFYGFVLFSVGLTWKWTSVRLASLVVLAATTVKVFLSDVWELAPVIRYLAFIGLGLALLTISYFYHRFRDRLREFVASEKSV